MTLQRVRERARTGSASIPLAPAFYDRDTEEVARDLLGALLVHRTPEGTASGRIVEVEAYLGPHDPACHSASGVTRRNRALHGPPGTAYVYRIYGLHWCVNAVTREVGHGSAVLVRAIEPVEGIALMKGRRGTADVHLLASGPGRLCQALAIDHLQDGARLYRGALRIVRGARRADEAVAASARIGITRAADWPLRYFIPGNPFVSRR